MKINTTSHCDNCTYNMYYRCTNTEETVWKYDTAGLILECTKFEKR